MQTVFWTPAYVALGSNLNDPLRQVRAGFDALHSLPETRLVARSHLYRSQPLGPQDQPDFINAAVGLLTRLDASTLLVELKKLEASLGKRPPVQRWGPRVIDFDLLVFGSERIATDALTVPHPGVATRHFVLVPLRDIAPDLDVPGVGRVAQLAERVGCDGLNLVE